MAQGPMSSVLVMIWITVRIHWIIELPTHFDEIFTESWGMA